MCYVTNYSSQLIVVLTGVWTEPSVKWSLLRIVQWSVFSSACVYTAELLSWRSCLSSVSPSSVNLGFSETAAWIQAKFYGKLPMHHISRPFFLLSKFSSNFYDFFSFSLTWDPMGAKISKRYSSSSFHPIWAKLYDNLGRHEGIKSYGIYVYGTTNIKCLWCRKHFMALWNLTWESIGKS